MDFRQLRPSVLLGLLSLPIALGLIFITPVVVLGEDWWATVVLPLILTSALGGLVWFLSGQYLRFSHAFATAGVAFLSLTPVTVLFLVGMEPTVPSTLAEYWRPIHHANAFLPFVFMFALGAARTRRQRLGTVGLILVPTLFEMADTLVINPESVLLQSPLMQVAGTVLVLFTTVAFGGPLFVLGQLLTSPRRNWTFRRLARDIN